MRPTPDHKIDRLAEIPALAGLDHRTLGRVAQLVDLVTVPAGVPIVTAGRRGAGAALLVDPKSPVRLGTGQIVPAGASVGMRAAASGMPAESTVVAVQDTAVLAVAGSAVTALLDAVPALARAALSEPTTAFSAGDQALAA